MARTQAKPHAGPGEAALSGAYGFDPSEAEGHFLAFIPESSGSTAEVHIREQLVWKPEMLAVMAMDTAIRAEGQLRVRLSRPHWDAIADVVRAEFNTRLRSQGKAPGKWKVGFNPMARTLGKELTVLAWAIEQADVGLCDIALSNWLGLAPEERWWLYTMTAAATGHFKEGQGLGWRKALRFALTESPAQGVPVGRPQLPDAVRRALERQT